jgi:serine/threonine-protein kinase
MRQRKAAEVARRLVDAHRKAGATSPPPADHGAKPWRTIAAGVAIAIVGIGAIGAYRAGWLAGGASDEQTPAPARDPAADAAARRETACEAGRKNVYSRRAVDQFGTEGWVAELWLARKGDASLADHQAVKALIEGGKIPSSADEALAALPAGSIEVATDDAAATAGYRTVTLRFGGGYARAFLADNAMRARFVGLAERTAQAASAELGALYGRCAHLPYHDIGAWFWGADRARAAAALLYGAGGFTEAPTIDRRKFAGAGELEALAAAAAKLDARVVGEAVSGAGGAVVEPPKPDGPTAFTFPLLGGTGAGSASATLARGAGVAVTAQ